MSSWESQTWNEKLADIWTNMNIKQTLVSEVSEGMWDMTRASFSYGELRKLHTVKIKAKTK